MGKISNLFSAQARGARIQSKLDELRQRMPGPVFWLFGKTQSGKTSIIKYLTGAEEAEIGHGFQPCTRFSRHYEFPTPAAPLLTFLDTRGVDEPQYDPAEDLAQFDSKAHVVIVTVKAMDHAQENVAKHLRNIRRARPDRPIVLVLTCLHEAYPQQQHPQPYPYAPLTPSPQPDRPPPIIPEGLARSIEEHRLRFKGLVDRIVPVDLTRPEEGFADPTYGGPMLKETLLGVLPTAYRQTLLTLDEASQQLMDVYAQNALPHIVGYATMATTAGAIPLPWIDLLILPVVQTGMITHLASLYGQPLSASRFFELMSTLGLGIAFRQAIREFVKFIPYVGSVAGEALAGASTFALGKAFCYYYSAIHKGHVPKADELRRYYKEQLAQAEKWWRKQDSPEPSTTDTEQR